MYSVDADRLVDILKPQRAEVLVADLDPTAEMAVGILRNADTARFGHPLYASRHIHAVAEDVTPFGDNVAEIHSDAELDPPIRGRVGIALR